MVAYVVAHPEIDNVLISGGDAFMNANATIRAYLEAFCALDQIQLIRFGTRTPVVLPQRITGDDELVEILEHYSRTKQIYVATQFNHPKEITDEAALAVRTLLRSGVVVKNQSVLLKNVNDDDATIASLMTQLMAHGVVPYYLFQCRPVRGALNKFQVPILRGIEIVENAKSQMNGQAKCFRYAMSHPTGKIEILGVGDDGKTLLKYHQAKDPEDAGRLFARRLEPDQCWL